MKLPTVLTIAGSDSSGGAGMQADIKTMTMHGVYAMSAVTALTAQNTAGVTAILEVPPPFLDAQLDQICTDIRPDAVKIGMIPSADLMRHTAEKLAFYQLHNIVLDPVMVSTSGADLMQREAIAALQESLLPLATLITPNIPEAEVLTGHKIENEVQMEEAAQALQKDYGCAVLLKGGHSVSDANDLLCQDGQLRWFRGKRISNPNTHGTGCTLSSAISANLAAGHTLADSIEKAKAYISGALEAMLDLGKGSGPLHHGYILTKVERVE